MDIISMGTGITSLFGGSAHYGPTSNPRAAGLSLIGPRSGYPKIWVNNSSRDITLSDTQNMYTVKPGGRIQQGNGTLTGILIPVGSGSYPVNNGNQTEMPGADPWPAVVPNRQYTPPVSLQREVPQAPAAVNSAGIMKLDSSTLLIGAILLYFVSKS